ncbi:MAG: STAS domain-containing protein [Rectinemataceae bacterium]
MREEAVYIDDTGPDVRIAVSGHMTARLCPALKAAFMSRLAAMAEAAEAAPHAVRIDLSNCEYMDSSFLGLLVQCSKASTAAGFGRPVLHRVGEVCMDLLSTMGMTRLFDFSGEPCVLGSARSIDPEGELGARFLLETHRELEILSPENRARFRDLTAMLEKESAAEDSPL